MNSDPPGDPTFNVTYNENPHLDIKRVWLKNQKYTVRCNSDPGNPPNNYRLMINGDTDHDGPEYTITARRDLHQGVLVCDVYNKFTEYKTKPKSVNYTINVQCK